MYINNILSIFKSEQFCFNDDPVKCGKYVERHTYTYMYLVLGAFQESTWLVVGLMPRGHKPRGSESYSFNSVSIIQGWELGSGDSSLRRKKQCFLLTHGDSSHARGRLSKTLKSGAPDS